VDRSWVRGSAGGRLTPMSVKKKTKKKQTELKKTAAKKGRPVKRPVRKKLAKKKLALRKGLEKRPALKKAPAKTKALGKKAAGAKAAGAFEKRTPGESQSLDAEAMALQGFRSRSAVQSGDLQGLSNVEAADSESVDELIEEGNAFEADVVAGVESAGDADEKEVRTHEVPEDDVPGEYLDKE
jgi:hypothetical protein